MKVVRRFQNQDIHIFLGEVYISDQKLIRLVHVRDLLVPVGKRIFHIGFYVRKPYNGKKAKEPESDLKSSRFSLFRRKKQEKKQENSENFQLISRKTYGFVWKWTGVYFLVFAGTRR